MSKHSLKNAGMETSFVYQNEIFLIALCVFTLIMCVSDVCVLYRILCCGISATRVLIVSI